MEQVWRLASPDQVLPVRVAAVAALTPEELPEVAALVAVALVRVATRTLLVVLVQRILAAVAVAVVTTAAPPYSVPVARVAAA